MTSPLREELGIVASDEVWNALRSATGLTPLTFEERTVLRTFIEEHLPRFPDVEIDGWTESAREDYLDDLREEVDTVVRAERVALDTVADALDSVTQHFDDILESFRDPDLDLDRFEDELTLAVNRLDEAKRLLDHRIEKLVDAFDDLTERGLVRRIAEDRK